MSMSLPYYLYKNQVLSNRYRQTVLGHLHAICEARYGLAIVTRSFEIKERLRPVECDRLKAILLELRASLKNFDDFLKDGSKLPQGAAPKRYKVYISLSYLQEHIQRTIPVLTAFRSVCLDSSRESYKLLAEVRQRLHTLLEASEALKPETKEMLARVASENVISLPVSTQSIDYKN